MPRIKIKPLSVNQAWQGRRFKSKAYLAYEKELSMLLPHMGFEPDTKLSITLTFGLSNVQSDWDNPIKPLVDVLQNKYSFNDNRIYKATVVKQKVKKGEEFIDFEITPLDE